MYSGQWSCYDITVVKDKWLNGGGGVALLPLAHRGSKSQEHLSEIKIRKRRQEKGRANVLEGLKNEATSSRATHYLHNETYREKKIKR